MNPSHKNFRRGTGRPISAVTQACRPMADYLFDHALGASPSEQALRAAQSALMPLRGHPGRLGWAVNVLLGGGTSRIDYDHAVSVLFTAARGDLDDEADGSGDNAELAPIIPLLPGNSGVPADQLAFPGLGD